MTILDATRRARQFARLSYILSGLLVTGLGCEAGRARMAGGSDKPDPGTLVRTSLRGTLTAGRGLPGVAPSKGELTDLKRLYEASGQDLLWVNESGKLRKVGKEAVALLNGADSEGLRPADYAAAKLDSLGQSLASGSGDPDPNAVARLDAGLSLALMRFLRDVHGGRVNPRNIGFQMDRPDERHDLVSLVIGAAEEGDLADVVRSLEPPLAQYRLVRDTLVAWRARFGDSLTDEKVRVTVPLKPGEASPELGTLRRRLALLGDLGSSDDTPDDSTKYRGPLVEAVARFQLRHGLTPDSVIGQETLDQLNVPIAWRTHQLDLALERLRWLRDLPNEPFLLVNIPMFDLTAWQSPMSEGPPLFRTSVIVGKAFDTQTPVFQDEMRYLIFRPYWNVPTSILQNEILPAIESDQDYLRKNDLEIVKGQGDDADPVEVSKGALERLADGQLRVRQRPGTGNSLGLVKFVFPNSQSIYLHGTPAKELFDRTRRDFSHGCVRVEDPVGLAEWLLRDQPEWDAEKILAAMHDESRISRRVNLRQPVTVVLFYTTAVVESDGTVRFARDIYGHDERLDRELHRQ